MAESKNRTRRAMASPLARLVTFPTRLRIIGVHFLAVARLSLTWLFTSREYTNFTYALTPRNEDHLTWFVAEVTGVPRAQIQTYMAEIADDSELRAYVAKATKASDYRRVADANVEFGRRMGWYAIVRAVGPASVVESGTDKGLGSVVLAAALLRNVAEGRPGRLTTIDINPEAGYLVGGEYAEVCDLVISDSLEALPRLELPIDVFIHDSNHSAEHEAAELQIVEKLLSADGLLLSDNSHVTDELSLIAKATNRNFVFFGERPLDHFYAGAGIGVAWSPRT